MKGFNMIRHHDTILDSINEGVFTVDPDWKIIDFNRAAESITGIPRDKAIGQRCYDIFRANICENTCALKRTIKDGRPVVNVTARIVDFSGNQIPIRVSAALLRDQDDNVIGGVETFQDITQIEQLKKELESRYTFEDIIGRGQSMQRLFQVLPQIAESESTVLIEGESGTGKELFARATHNLSRRRKKRFVAINCAALPDTLLESELFGYKAGAFTGAIKSKPGRFTIADGGTIFLDEIGDISPAMQSRLLRVLQEKRVEPLGSVESVKVDVRIIAATNKNIKAMMKAGAFREDLYYRIQVIRLKLPELRERREDIPLLIDHLIAKFGRLKGKNLLGVSDRVLHLLMEHDFPGNVRELENIIEHASVLCNGEFIEIEHLPPELRHGNTPAVNDPGSSMDLKSVEKRMIVEALYRNHGNRRCAAGDLGIDTSTLYRKIRAYNLTLPQTDGRAHKEKENRAKCNTG